MIADDGPDLLLTNPEPSVKMEKVRPLQRNKQQQQHRLATAAPTLWQLNRWYSTVITQRKANPHGAEGYCESLHVTGRITSATSKAAPWKQLPVDCPGYWPRVNVRSS